MVVWFERWIALYLVPQGSPPSRLCLSLSLSRSHSPSTALPWQCKFSTGNPGSVWPLRIYSEISQNTERTHGPLTLWDFLNETQTGDLMTTTRTMHSNNLSQDLYSCVSVYICIWFLSCNPIWWDNSIHVDYCISFFFFFLVLICNFSGTRMQSGGSQMITVAGIVGPGLNTNTAQPLWTYQPLWSTTE